MWQTIILTNDDLIQWCIYAVLGGDELITKFNIYISFNIVSHLNYN